jgi:hypothetical protein
MSGSSLLAVVLGLGLQLTIHGFAQGVQPYPHAITDRVVRTETPMHAPQVNHVFRDPDFGSLMVRVTDGTTDRWHAGGYMRSPSAGESNAWSSDSRKLYVTAEEGATLAFGFDPSTMLISPLPGASGGHGLRVPLHPDPTFSFVDPDLIYGTTQANRLTISEYRFSTATITAVVDTTKCGVQPPLDVTNPLTRADDDIGLSADDSRISISEGGPEPGEDPFVVVYDKKLGCRWYNTQTGQIGGQWGPSGYAQVPGFLIGHARISGNGKYVRISAAHLGFYIWDLETLSVTHCNLDTDLDCGGYGTFGRSTYVNEPGRVDEMNVVKRPAGDLAAFKPLVWPLPVPSAWEQEMHFTWINGHLNDNIPVCVSVYNYDGDREISRPWDDEIICIETDGLASTVWRFAHHRTYWVNPYFNTQPLGNISRDGRFFSFTSTWDGQLGLESSGTPRSDVWIVKLN